MYRTTATLFCLLALAGVSLAQNLLVNGDFEQSLDVGWLDTAVNLAGEARFERADTFGRPGFAAKAYKTLASYGSLSQTVDVPSAGLTLTFDGRFNIGGGSSTCWPVAAFMVRYLNAGGASLGKSVIYLHDQYCSWARNDTQNLIDINSPGMWTPFTLDIAEEIAAHLPGVPAADVRKVTVELYAFDNGT